MSKKNDPYSDLEWDHFEGLELYLNLFELIPDDIMLTLATQDLHLDESDRCVCGWAVRDAIALRTRKAAEDIDLNDDSSVPYRLRAEAAKYQSYGWTDEVPAASSMVPELCVVLFGATRHAWNKLFQGVIEPGNSETIERAMLLRMLQVTE